MQKAIGRLYAVLRNHLVTISLVPSLIIILHFAVHTTMFEGTNISKENDYLKLDSEFTFRII